MFCFIKFYHNIQHKSRWWWILIMALTLNHCSQDNVDSLFNTTSGSTSATIHLTGISVNQAPITLVVTGPNGSTIMVDQIAALSHSQDHTIIIGKQRWSQGGDYTIKYEQSEKKIEASVSKIKVVDGKIISLGND